MGVPRAVNAYSASLNWTAQRLQTANGFGVIGVGLNSRVRGARLEEQRPDLIILDDVDETHVKYFVTGVRPSWPEGQGLDVAEKQINDWGLATFKTESQHEDAPEGGLWNKEAEIDPYRVPAAPKQLTRIVIGIDPPGGATEAGIVSVGRDHQATPHLFVLKDDSIAAGPNEWMQRAISRYWDLEADALVVETNFGGDMVKAGIRNLDPRVAVIEVRASRGKQIRAEPVQLLYPEGRVHHVGHFPDLENEMCTWQPGMKSPNRLDALVWSATDLLNYKTTAFNFDTLVSTTTG